MVVSRSMYMSTSVVRVKKKTFFFPNPFISPEL